MYDQFDLELLHGNDHATRRQNNKDPRFNLLLHLFFYMIVFHFRSVLFSFVTFDVFAMSCFISRVFF
jgi:hypothetical protein